MEEKQKIGKTENVTLDNATIEQLKIAAFDIDQQVKALKSQYQLVMNKLNEKIREDN